MPEDIRTVRRYYGGAVFYIVAGRWSRLHTVTVYQGFVARTNQTHPTRPQVTI